MCVRRLTPPLRGDRRERPDPARDRYRRRYRARSVSAILRGGLRPSAALRARFAEVLGVDETALFELHPDIIRLVEWAVAQGLGHVVDDPNVLRQVATITRAADPRTA